MTYRGGRFFRLPVLFVALIVSIQISGCATTPTTNPQFTASQQWHQNVDGNYVHVSGRVISEEQYAQMMADQVRQQLNGLAKTIPKKCKRKIRN